MSLWSNPFISILYAGIACLVFVLFHIVSFFSTRTRNFLKLRKNSKLQLIKDIQNYEFLNKIQNQEVIWLHGASVGELEQAKAFANYLRKIQHPCFIVFSWVSDSVKDKNLQGTPFDYHIPLPIDCPYAYNPMVSFFRPKKVLIFSWDAWLFFVRSIKNYGGKVYLVCASLNEQSGRFHWFAKRLTQTIFQELDGIYPSHINLIPQFYKLLSGTKNKKEIEALGDTRFEAVINKIQHQSPPSNFQKFLKISQINNGFNRKPNKKNKKIFLFASTYPICERAIVEFYSHQPQVIGWIFPHKIQMERILALQSTFHELKISCSLFSKILAKEENPHSSIILFDELGILAFAYQFGCMAYVGGGFQNRIHNTIEPAYFGLPILTGPRIQNAPEAMVMKELGSLVSVDNPKDMVSILLDWSQRETKEFFQIGKKNKNFVLENKGASSKIYQKIWLTNPSK